MIDKIREIFKDNLAAPELIDNITDDDDLALIEINSITSVSYTHLIDKTVTRLNTIKSISGFQIFFKNEFVINNKYYHSIEYYIKHLHFIFDELFERDIQKFSIIHGDFCFSNILYDFNSYNVKLIDPRGSFGCKGIYGDLRYDIAKLRHSVCGLYDFVIADKYTAELIGSVINYKLDTCIDQASFELFDNFIIENGYNITEIKFIEALLFLSMIPCHADSPERQIVMLAKGIEQIDIVIKYINNKEISAERGGAGVSRKRSYCNGY